MMTATVSIRETVNDVCVTGRYLGGVLRKSLREALAADAEVTVDFDGIEMITQSAADEFVGRMLRDDSRALDHVCFVNCVAPVKEMLQWAAENYDSIPASQAALTSA